MAKLVGDALLLLNILLLPLTGFDANGEWQVLLNIPDMVYKYIILLMIFTLNFWKALNTEVKWSFVFIRNTTVTFVEYHLMKHLCSLNLHPYVFWQDTLKDQYQGIKQPFGNRKSGNTYASVFHQEDKSSIDPINLFNGTFHVVQKINLKWQLILLFIKIYQFHLTYKIKIWFYVETEGPFYSKSCYHWQARS